MTQRLGMTALLTLIATTGGSAQTVWFVDDDGPLTGGCGSWADACPELQTALSLASAGDQVWVAVGTYRPDYDPALQQHTGDRLAAFELVCGLELYGGFAGAEETLEERVGLFQDTVLTGDLNNDDEILFPVFYGNFEDNSERVVSAVDADGSTIFDGFAIRQGYVQTDNLLSAGMVIDNASPVVRNTTFQFNTGGQGGAIRIFAGNPTISDCLFVNNNGADGGAVYIQGGSPAITGCTFLENIAGTVGGAVSIRDSGQPAFDDCVIQGNISGLFAGGGVSNFYAEPVFENCSFIGNDGWEWGGGLYNSDGAVVLTDCVFDNNIANGDGFGGGLANVGFDASALVTNSTFANNIAVGLGGGVLNTGGTIELRHCSLLENITELGGGMFNDGTATMAACTVANNEALQAAGGLISVGTLTAVNCIFSDNSAFIGGGVLQANGGLAMDLTNCIFRGNTAVELGGGLWAGDGELVALTHCTFTANVAASGGALASFGPNLTVANSILWNNMPDQIDGPVQVRFSDVQGGFPGEGNIDADPMFVLEHGPIGKDAGLDLGSGSPCIDVGDTSALPPDTLDSDGDGDVNEVLPVDIDGDPRQFDDPDTSNDGAGEGVPVDMGAQEFQVEVACPADLNDDLLVGSGDLALLLGNWGPNPGSPADFNDDGVVSGADLAILLGSWGPCD